MLAPVRPWGSTAIYDAIMAAIPMADTRHKQRAALLVVSDGADTASDTRLRDLRTALLRTDVFVYAIGIDSADRAFTVNAAVNPVTLGEITDPSGGRTRVVHDNSEVVEALEQIANELNSPYLIGYGWRRGRPTANTTVFVCTSAVARCPAFGRATDMWINLHHELDDMHYDPPVLEDSVADTAFVRVVRVLGATLVAGWMAGAVVDGQQSTGKPPAAAPETSKPATNADSTKVPAAREPATLQARLDRQRAATERALFASDDPLPVTLIADFKAVNRDRDPESTRTFPERSLCPVGSEEKIGSTCNCGPAATRAGCRPPARSRRFGWCSPGRPPGRCSPATRP